MDRERADSSATALNTEVTLNYDNKLDLIFEMQIRAMKGDLIATAINTGDFSKVDSLNSAKST